MSTYEIGQREAVLCDVCAEIVDLVDRVAVCGIYRACGDDDMAVLVPDDSVWSEILMILGCEPIAGGQLHEAVTITRSGFQIDIARVKNKCEAGAQILLCCWIWKRQPVMTRCQMLSKSSARKEKANAMADQPTSENPVVVHTKEGGLHCI